jgi:hypothetical protein
MNNPRLQKQFDEACRDDIMTFPEYQNRSDTIGEFGCLLTAKCNAFNLYNFQKPILTISNLNKKIIENNGYEYLYYKQKFDNDIVKIKQFCFGQESALIPKVINSILGIEEEELNINQNKVNIADTYNFFIIKMKYKNTGHFSLIMKSDLTYFDSYTGIFTKPVIENILDIRRIKFKGV